MRKRERDVKNVIERIKKTNTSLPDLLVGILLVGIFFEAIGILFVQNLIFYTIELWLGIFLSIGMIVHMATVLNRAVSIGQNGAEKLIRSQSFIRYGVVVLVLSIIMLTDVLNPLIVFLGIMSLKVAAYLQPITHKLVKKLFNQ